MLNVQGDIEGQAFTIWPVEMRPLWNAGVREAVVGFELVHTGEPSFKSAFLDIGESGDCELSQRNDGAFLSMK